MGTLYAFLTAVLALIGAMVAVLLVFVIGGTVLFGTGQIISWVVRKIIDAIFDRKS